MKIVFSGKVRTLKNMRIFFIFNYEPCSEGCLKNHSTILSMPFIIFLLFVGQFKINFFYIVDILMGELESCWVSRKFVG